MRRYGSYIPLLLLFLLFPMEGIYESVTFTRDSVELFNAKAGRDARGNTVYTIQDVTYERNELIPHITDLTLSFNRGSQKMLRDDTRHYRVPYASYLLEKKNGVVGAGAAKFFHSDHRVEIETDENQWLGSCEDLGSFAIEFRFRPIQVREGTVLFSRIGFLSGRRNGIEIALNAGRVSVRLYGIFKDASGRRIDVFLNRGRVIEADRWYHFILSYDRISGRLAKYINESEEEVVYVSEQEEPYVNTYEPSFQCEDKPIAVIGKDYIGLMDEFRIAYRHIEDVKKETDLAYRKYQRLVKNERLPVNKEGVVTSPVYQLPLTGTMIKLFKWNEDIPPQTFIWMEFRISDRLFLRADDEPAWYRVNNGQRNIFQKKIDNGEFLRGKYYQWRAHLVPSPDGKRSPALSELELRYQLDPAPRAPQGVEVVRAGDTSVRLKWRPNVESDLLGYRVYYGLVSGKYDGVISVSGGRRISNGMNGSSGAVQIDITNEIIEENKKLDTKGVLTYPMLKNTVLYFFAVSAYDNYKPDTQFNHESRPSKEVSARPYAGSQIE